MRAADIQVGQHYEVREGGVKSRALVLDKGTFEKRVYSGERSDFRGHLHKGTYIKVRFDYHRDDQHNLVTPAQVLRLWADANADHQAAKAREEFKNERLARLNKALNLGLAERVRWDYSVVSHRESDRFVTLPIEALENLLEEAGRLPWHGEEGT